MGNGRSAPGWKSLASSAQAGLREAGLDGGGRGSVLDHDHEHLARVTVHPIADLAQRADLAEIELLEGPSTGPAPPRPGPEPAGVTHVGFRPSIGRGYPAGSETPRSYGQAPATGFSSP